MPGEWKVTAQQMLDLFCAIGEIEQYEGMYKLSKGGVLHKHLTQKLASTIRDLPTDKMPHNIKIRTNKNKELELYKASYALVIGNGNYAKWNSLPGALQDVNEVKDVLVKHGFNVTLKTDLNKKEFDEAVAQFVLESGKNKDNRLLFYYAGHGHTRKAANGEDFGYLVMVDAPIPDTDEIGFEVASIDMSSLVTQAEKIQARHVLFMFDSCFSGTIFNVRNELQLPEGIFDSVKYPVRQFITAGREGETVPDRSHFKVAFLDLIQGHVPEPIPDGYITGEELGYYLKHEVPKYIEGQHPQYGKIRNPKLDKGDFVFVLPRTNIVGDLAELVLTERIVFCESRGFDSECYRNIFNSRYPGLRFIPLEDRGNVEKTVKAANLALGKIAKKAMVIGIVDQDNATLQEVERMKEKGIRTLSRRTIENFLLDDEVLSKLCEDHGKSDKIGDLLTAKQEALNKHNLKPYDNLKAIVQTVHGAAQRALKSVRLGNSKESFMMDILAPLIKPGMAVYEQLHEDIFGE